MKKGEILGFVPLILIDLYIIIIITIIGSPLAPSITIIKNQIHLFIYYTPIALLVIITALVIVFSILIYLLFRYLPFLEWSIKIHILSERTIFIIYITRIWIAIFFFFLNLLYPSNFIIFLTFIIITASLDFFDSPQNSKRYREKRDIYSSMDDCVDVVSKTIFLFPYFTTWWSILFISFSALGSVLGIIRSKFRAIKILGGGILYFVTFYLFFKEYFIICLLAMFLLNIGIHIGYLFPDLYDKDRLIIKL